ncbi:type I-E CRISPR-associated protein Cse2/CasB [Streptomyces sp. BPPL-273]|uniref:type I-E CRISPR-associated protein Cse2/CasB n=1 Tax=Streptomyces sp. BPPL-273 TaxID=2987533 RepID=UPI0024AED1D8|nr:type I-E CRISPR-associated protein Cse2/CasB [Streptomyces sp. BPPL-273]WHM35059.1 type I-E CRISPR-associated protein Cse2/CasB [Streptomyces sp. BPPL-273]
MTTTASASAPPTPVPVPVPVDQRVAELAATLIAFWQEGHLKDRSPAVAALARLRRGAGREAGETPDLWSLIDTDPLHAPAEAMRPLSEQELERAENALHAALTLWAFHQQSRKVPMHRRHTRERPGGLGAAVRRLMPADGTDAPVRKRLVRAGTAPDLVTLAQRLRDIVALLRSAKTPVPLDYGLLAGQLYLWQWPDGPATVRRRWGRSFHELPRPLPDTDHKPAPASDENTTPDTDKDAS